MQSENVLSSLSPKICIEKMTLQGKPLFISGKRVELILFWSSFIFRILLILAYPMIFGADSNGRMFERDRIFLHHWLPVTQFVVFSVYKASASFILVRIAFAAIGSFLSVYFYRYLSQFQDQRSSFLGALIFSILPLNVALSTVPYQEIPFLLFLIAFLYYLESDRINIGLIFYGLACLTRYEAWIFFPFAAFLIYQKMNISGQSPKLLTLAGRLVFACWGIVLWLILNQIIFGHFLSFFTGYGRSSSYFEIQSPINLLLPYWWILKYGSPIIVLGIIGMVSLRSRRFFKVNSLRISLLWVFVLLIALPLKIPLYNESYRFAMIPICFLAMFIVPGIEMIFNKFRIKEWIYPVVFISVFTYTCLYFHHISTLVAVREPYRIYMDIDNDINRNQKMLIIAEEGENAHSYIRLSGYSTCGKECFFLSYHYPLDTSDKLDTFILTNRIHYILFFPEGAFPDDRNRIYRRYPLNREFEVIQKYESGILYRKK